MEDFVLNTPDFRLLYNCSMYDVDSVPLAQRQHPFLGVICVAISIIEEAKFIFTKIPSEFLLLKKLLYFFNYLLI
jgi:hypothetical protein